MPSNLFPNFIHLLTYSVDNQSGYVALALATTTRTAVYYYPMHSPDHNGELTMFPLNQLQNNSQIWAIQRCTNRPTDLREMQAACDAVNALPGDKRRWGWWDWTVALLRAMPRDMIDFGALAAFALNTGLELQG